MAERAATPNTRAPEGLIVHIGAVQSGLPPAERRVAGRVLADPAGVATRTITDLAAAAATSEASVIRFCRSVGLTGYPQLRIRLAAEAARLVEGPDPGVLAGDIPAGADMARVIATVTFNDARAVEETAGQLDPEVCEQVVTAIARAGRVDVYGAGASGVVAADLQQKLHRIGRTAQRWADVPTALASAAQLRSGDVALVISHSGRTSGAVDVLRAARERGALAVAVTGYPRSPLATIADRVLTTAVRETTYRSGATVSRLAQMTVVDCLFVGVAVRSRTRARRALRAAADVNRPVSQGDRPC